MTMIRLWQAVHTEDKLSEDDIHQIIACEYGMGWYEDGPDIDIPDEELPIRYNHASQNIKDFLKEAKGRVIFDQMFELPVKDLFSRVYSKNGEKEKDFLEKR